MDSQGLDSGLEALLELDGEVFPMDNGYWTKFEVRMVEASDKIPHGIRYSLTLHDRHNRRILGYDNAHGIKPSKRGFGARRVEWDHKHEQRTVVPYSFKSAGRLMEDFWNDVNRILVDSQRAGQ